MPNQSLPTGPTDSQANVDKPDTNRDSTNQENNTKQPSEISLENVHDRDLSPNMANNEKTKEQIEQRIQKWTEGINKDIAEVLKKYGVTKYQMSYIHHGTQNLMLHGSGDLYEATLLSKEVYKTLLNQMQNKLTL